MSEYKLICIKQIKGTIKVVTGLHIGASADTMEISGLDNPILRNPANAEPYIPGSSIKGRMRSLAEWYFQEIPDKGDVINAKPETKTARVFGISANKNIRPGPTRLIVRDAYLTKEWREKFRNGIPITEVKSENSINRLSAMANPRPIERVVPGVEFACEMVFRIFELGNNTSQHPTDEKLFEEVLLNVALPLLEADALGGGGSRGNGKVELDLSVDGESLQIKMPSFPHVTQT